MNNRELLKQARKGLQDSIRNEGILITVSVYPLKNNGYGKLIPDYTQAPTDTQIRARIALEAGQPAEDVQNPAGLSTNNSRFILTDYRTEITQGAKFSGDKLDKDFTIGAVTSLIKFGGIYGYQAPLSEAISV